MPRDRVSSSRPGKEEEVSAVGQLQCHSPGLVKGLRTKYGRRDSQALVWFRRPGSSGLPRRVPFLHRAT